MKFICIAIEGWLRQLANYYLYCDITTTSLLYEPGYGPAKSIMHRGLNNRKSGIGLLTNNRINCQS